jgi:hypothetical protein
MQNKAVVVDSLRAMGAWGLCDTRDCDANMHGCNCKIVDLGKACNGRNISKCIPVQQLKCRECRKNTEECADGHVGVLADFSGCFWPMDVAEEI